ncbi:MAG: hypothetical protein JWL85_580 [Candidatus Saccharibacteria bacterium]|nr:hypothetical protein [Candidatus Saccharibacteria bacterium]
MDHFKQLQEQVKRYLFAVMFASNLIVIGAAWAAFAYLEINVILALAGLGVTALVTTILLSGAATRYVLEPLHMLWQAILHISPGYTGTPAPDLKKIRLGRELITSLTLQVYQYASQSDSQDLTDHRNKVVQAANVVSHLPLPMFVFNKQLLVTNASDAALEYCQIESAQLFGKPLYESVQLEFPSELTLEAWISECQANKVTDKAYWERIRVRLPGDTGAMRQCDMAAYYSKDSPSGTEVIITMFDRTAQYDQDDQAMGFVALAVHELRTPVTMLRGYIEVFEEELGDQLDDELKDFMHKMQVSARQLTSFVNNILNVARIDENQMSLHLNEEKWDVLLPHILEELAMRAKMYGKEIKYVPGANLPTVAVDRVSINQVVNNLIDNAIKYSGESKEIIVTSSLNQEGMVETSVKDSGVGIPESVIPNLFEKFFRNHRTRAKIGGSGLGLYLCKALIGGHGGNIWVNSKEGEGSTFTFTLLPYSKLADEQKTGNNTDIVRQTHGWIKNHSMYRR